MSKPNSTTGPRSPSIEMGVGTELVSSEESSTESESSSAEKKAKQLPKLEQRQRARAGTWVAATTTGATISTSEKVVKAREKASEPTLSPRGPLPPLPKSDSGASPISSGISPSASGVSIPSTSTPSTSQPLSPKPAAYIKSKVPGSRIPADLASILRAGFKGMKSVPEPNNPAHVIQVPVFNIPPAQIARLMVGMESNFGTQAPSAENFNKPLRDRFAIVSFQIDSANVLQEINVIEHILMPFIQRTFDTPEAEKARIEVRDRFNTFVCGPHKNLLRTEEGKNAKQETLQNLVFRKEFDTVIQPLRNLISGSGHNLESSQLSSDFTIFLQEIVSSYIKWSEQQEISPKQLTNMMKSALVGMLFIRGLLPVWNTKFEADMRAVQHADSEWVAWKPKLSALLAHYTSFSFDDFVLDVIASIDHKPKEFEKYFKPLMKAATLRQREATTANLKQEKGKRLLARGATISGAVASNAERRPNLGNLIKGLISPRHKETTDATPAPLSPRGTRTAEHVQSSDGLLLKKTETRATRVKRARQRDLNAYLKSIKLPNYDPGYIRHLSKAISGRASYELFEDAPAAFCLQQLEQYVESLKDAGAASSPQLSQLQEFLSKLSEQEQAETKPSTQPTRPQTSKPNQGKDSSVVPAIKPAIAEPSSVPTLDLSVLRKSPFAEDSASEAEIDSNESTEIETEQSEDETSNAAQASNQELEKNRS